MESAQGSYAYQSPVSRKNSFFFPMNKIAAIVISLILGLGVGFFSGQMIAGSSLGSKSLKNAVFTSKPIYFASVEGTLISKGSNKITIEKNGSNLEIEVPVTAPALIQDANNPGAVSTKTIGDVEIGTLLKGSVQVSEQFLAGDKSGKVTGSSFFVTKK